MLSTCYKCGSSTSSTRQRLCLSCRKPRDPCRRASITRELSFREKQITALVAQSKLNKEIAWETGLTEGTIKEYLNRLFKKLKLRNRVQLAMYWVNQQSLATKEQNV